LHISRRGQAQLAAAFFSGERLRPRAAALHGTEEPATSVTGLRSAGSATAVGMSRLFDNVPLWPRL